MKFTSSMILASAGLASATNLCTGTSRNEGGNWFCSKVNMIKYDGVGASGTYKEVTGMSSNGQCPMKDVSYGGSFAPYNQDVSHIPRCRPVSILTCISFPFISVAPFISRSLPSIISTAIRSATSLLQLKFMLDAMATAMLMLTPILMERRTRRPLLSVLVLGSVVLITMVPPRLPRALSS